MPSIEVKFIGPKNKGPANRNGTLLELEPPTEGNGYCLLLLLETETKIRNWVLSSAIKSAQHQCTVQV